MPSMGSRSRTPWPDRRGAISGGEAPLAAGWHGVNAQASGALASGALRTTFRAPDSARPIPPPGARVRDSPPPGRWDRHARAAPGGILRTA